MLDKSVCHFRGVGVYFVAFILVLWKILSANNVAPDQTPRHVASNLSLHCLPITFYRFSGKNALERMNKFRDRKQFGGV